MKKTLCKSYSSAVLGLVLCFGVIFTPFPSLVSQGKASQKPLNSIVNPALKIPGQTIQEEESLLQFKSGGHIIGFKNDKVYMVGPGYVLTEEFVSASMVKPLAEKEDLSVRATRGKGGVSSLSKVSYKDLWKGITAIYEAKESGIAESTFIVNPHADVGQIRLRYNTPVELQKDGSMRFVHQTNRRYFTQSSPVAWQEINGTHMPVKISFMVSRNEVSFSVGKYNSSYPLIIDPAYVWHTFVGKGGLPVMNAMATDNIGNIYITGTSVASWNGPAGQLPLNAYVAGGSTSSNFFVLKLDANGAYQWHTFYGPYHGESRGITVDSGGNVYVTGKSYYWSGPSGQAPLNSPILSNYSLNIFILKLDTNGSYLWHTLYGEANGTIDDNTGYGITVDGSGNVFVTGMTVPWNGPSGQAPLNQSNSSFGIFILKLNTNGEYQWHTFYGPDNTESGNGIVLDGSGNIYVTGESWGNWNGPSGQPPLHAFSSQSETFTGDIFVLKLDASGAYQWHTFYGTNYYDSGMGIALDADRNIYVTGDSDVSWSGPSGEPPLHYSGNYSSFILKLDTNGAYRWHTFYGADSWSSGIASDSIGNIYIAGESDGNWTGPSGQLPLNAFSGGMNGYDAFVLKLNTSGTYQWHTFYGPTNIPGGIALDNSGNIYVAGGSAAAWVGPSGQSPLNAYSSSAYMFVLKMSDSPNVPSNSVLTVNKSGTGNGNVIVDAGSINWSGNSGTATYNSNTSVTLTAMASNGSTFTSWSGCDSTNGNQCMVTMNSDRSVTATFTLNPTQYTLTVTKTGTGNGDITTNTGSINWSGNSGTATYDSNTSVTLTAIASNGSTFTSWSGCDSTNGNQCMVTMNGARSVTATFNQNIPDQYQLSVTKTGTGDGTITSSTKGINCGSACNETFPSDAKPKKVTLKLKPDAYSTFLGWGGDCQAYGTKTSCKLTMDSDKNVTASFGLPDIAVSPDSYDFGDVTVKQSSSPATFTIQNNGTGDLKKTKMKIVGTDAKMFKIKGSCSKAISSGGSCQFTVTFKPKSTGSKTATLQITSNDPDTATIEIPLSGTGI